MNDAAQAAFDEIREEYRRDLPASVAQIIDAAGRARPPTSDAVALRRATAGVHRIHGTAGTLGFHAVSAAAARAEAALGQAAASHAAWAEIDAALAELEALVRG